MGTNEIVETWVSDNSNVCFSEIERGLIGFFSVSVRSCGRELYCYVRDNERVPYGGQTRNLLANCSTAGSQAKYSSCLVEILCNYQQSNSKVRIHIPFTLCVNFFYV